MSRFFVTFLLAALIPAPAAAAETVIPHERSVIHAAADRMLAATDAAGNEQPQPPAPGSLVLPATATDDDRKQKKCMTVCARWGEECMLINRGAGGMERKCRRTCKQFAEECF
jgi:hypothetical protein